MRLDIASWTLTSAGGAVTSAAVAAAHSADAFTAALMALGGACSIVAALYYRSESDEKVARDAIVSIAMAFVVGAAGGQLAGELLDGLIFDRTGLHLSVIGQHMIGGAALGGVMTPVMRAVLTGKVANIISAARDFLDKISGGKAK